MSPNYHKTIISWWILMLVAVLDTVSHSCVEGLRIQDEASFGPMPKGTRKTIKVPDGGDVIDCVDIYKQPAFDNPLIKELKMVPKSIASETNRTRYHQPKLIQTWNKYGKCPEATIPIRRTWNNVSTHRKGNQNPSTREYATAIQRGNKIHGGRAVFNVWKPRVVSLNEFSLSQLWLADGPMGEKNTIEAGWTVYPGLFHDSLPRLFIYWTNNNYKNGCYNLLCGAFVQTSNDIALGNAYVSSVYDRQQTVENIAFVRSKDTEGGDWWLIVGQYVLGYYPRTLFPNYLGDGAQFIEFGGEIVNSLPGGHHTATTMGSGHFSAKGFKRACFISSIQIKNDTGITWVDAHLQERPSTNPACYDLTMGPSGTHNGSHFYFGGPGYSPHCQ